MNTLETKSFLFDIATYSLIGFFLCFFFIIWYLRKHEDPESEVVSRHSNWAILLFRYRDYTRNRFGKVHFLYYLTVLFLIVVILLFGLGFVLQLETLKPPLKYIVGSFGVLIISFILGMFYHMAKTRYYD